MLKYRGFCKTGDRDMRNADEGHGLGLDKTHSGKTIGEGRSTLCTSLHEQSVVASFAKASYWTLAFFETDFAFVVSQTIAFIIDGLPRPIYDKCNRLRDNPLRTRCPKNAKVQFQS